MSQNNAIIHKTILIASSVCINFMSLSHSFFTAAAEEAVAAEATKCYSFCDFPPNSNEPRFAHKLFNDSNGE